MVSINQDLDQIPEVQAKADDITQEKYFACMSAEDCIEALGDKTDEFVKYITSTGRLYYWRNAFQQLNQGWQGGQYNPGTLRGMSAQNYNAGAAPQAYQLQQFDPSKLQNDPGYQFQLNQGMNAVQNSAAAKGMLHSGNTLSGINSMAQGLANTTLNDAFSRYATQQNQGMQQGQNQFQNWQYLAAIWAR